MKRLAFAFALGVVLVSARAHARDDVSAAQTAFEEGRKLEAAGDYAGAIARFEESDRLDPALGTTLNLAACYEQAMRLASAWRTFLRGADEAAALGEERRAQRARELAGALRPRVSTLAVILPEGFPSDAIVTVDGAMVDVRTPLPLDGGTHRVVAVAIGYRAWSVDVTLGASRDEQAVRIPLLEADTPTERAAVATPVRVPEAPHAAAAPRASTWSPLRIAGVASAGAGVVGIGLGAAFGVRAGALWSDRQAQCVSNRCTESGYALTADARSAATRANVAFVLGGVALATGITLFVFAPRSTRVELTATALPGGGAFALGTRLE